jgi:glycosyltransferase involved in cell wall biosynthesis
VRPFQEWRIGYVPYTPTFERPGDRRRFCYYAEKRNIRFEIAQPSQTYDVIVLTEAADISVWSRYPRGSTKIIFDFVDSYFSIPRGDLKGMLRGAAKFVVGQHRRLRLNYWSALEDMCGRADAIICASEEQRAQILPFCQNVHPILDFHGSAVRACKSDYSAGHVFNFVWEGLASNIWQLLEIREVLRNLRKKRSFLLHVITELQYGRFLHNRFGKRNTADDVRKISSEICLYAWNEQTFSAIVRSCDLALIPIPLQNPLHAAKPENRLLLFWRMGLPVLASATAAYTRTMRECGLNMALATPREWSEALEYFISDEQARKHAGQRGKAFVEARHSEEKTLALWDEVFRSVLDNPAGEGSRPSLCVEP